MKKVVRYQCSHCDYNSSSEQKTLDHEKIHHESWILESVFFDKIDGEPDRIVIKNTITGESIDF